MPKKLKIGVLMGGPSSERPISLITGRAIYNSLDRKKYTPDLIEMAKNGQFFLLKRNKKTALDLQNKDRKKIDLIFIALHGTVGEDGCVQGMLDCLGIPYTGSGVLTSALAMNKVLSEKIYKYSGILTPNFVDFGIGEWLKNKKDIIKRIKKIKYPLVIKPVDQGSSVGVYIVRNEKELFPAIKKSFKYSNWLMAQKFIKGEEATCGVLEKAGRAFALPPTRIMANIGQFYDYKSKYKKGGSTHVCPADFPSVINKKIQSLAVQAHRALGCRGMSRTDFFVTPKRKIYIIETNTIPGMTPVSLLPESAGKAGISFAKMLELIIEVGYLSKSG